MTQTLKSLGKASIKPPTAGSAMASGALPLIGAIALGPLGLLAGLAASTGVGEWRQSRGVGCSTVGCNVCYCTGASGASGWLGSERRRGWVGDCGRGVASTGAKQGCFLGICEQALLSRLLLLLLCCVRLVNVIRLLLATIN